MSPGPAPCALAFAASRNAFVPLWATVPRWSITSCRDMPMPLSEMVSVFAALSGAILIFQSVLPSSLSALASASNRTLLMASDAFEISSRRKISLSE